MLTRRDVQKLQLSMADELNASSRSVLVCALLLLLLFGVVWFDAAKGNVTTEVVSGSTR